MRQILGIDVGGTKIAAGLVDRNYKVSQVSQMPTSQTDLVGQLVRLIESYDNFDAIGLGLPGQVVDNGIVTHMANLPRYKNLDLKSFFSNKFKVPVNVINDAKAFTLAEAILGDGKKFKTVVGVTLGTGIGGGVVIDKKLYLGPNYLVGEWGHIFIKDSTGLEQMMHKFGKFTKAKQAEPFARIIISVIIRCLDPDIIIFGGARSMLPGMQTILNRCLKLISKYPLKTAVKVSKLKHAGIIGAALPLLKK